MTKSELCIQCQECCKILRIAIPIQESTEYKETVKYYSEHGCITKNTKNSTVIEIPHKCQHLTDKGCNVYDKRPLMCRIYDGSIDELMKDRCMWITIGYDKNVLGGR